MHATKRSSASTPPPRRATRPGTPFGRSTSTSAKTTTRRRCPMPDNFTRAEVCCIAVAETFRGDGEILCNPIGTIPMIGGRLAKATFEPLLLMTDGEGLLVENPMPVGVDNAEKVVAGWNPYRTMFDWVWSGRRHVMMGATQIDQYGNQNIAMLGGLEQPKVQLLGFRGAPGNTINDKTSYWVPSHTPKTFVTNVDVVSGIGYDRAAKLDGDGGRFHCLPRVVSNLGVF